MVQWSERYLRHFVRFFGKPFDVQVFRHADGDALRIATFDRRYPGYLLYASLGLSDHVDDLQDLGEVILLSDDRGKAVPQIFLHALFFILQKKIPLGSHFSVGGLEVINPDFAAYYDKAALYFMLADGFPPGFDTIADDGETGHVYQGIFISWEEQDFLNRNGPAAFQDKLQDQDSDPCSLRRPSCV